MRTILITGSRGFIGKNLKMVLGRNKNVIIKSFEHDDEINSLDSLLTDVDFIYHLAGVNRPQDPNEFKIGNAHLTKHIVETLGRLKRTVPILLASSTQAALNNPYGVSKKKAEEILIDYSQRTKAPIFIYRLPGVFGKWSRPDYNTVVATFCHNIARDIEIKISDPTHEIDLVYIDDVVRHFIKHLNQLSSVKGAHCQSYLVDKKGGNKEKFLKVNTMFKVSLGDLAAKIYSLHDMRTSLNVPDLADYFMRCLNATYLSFLDIKDFSYPLDLKTDDRGSLFELIKSTNFGQIFLSKTFRGITRGNHYHDSKIEKFCVIQGKAAIRLRHILKNNIIEYLVSDKNIQVVDIPPGYTHHIENLGESEMIVLFWTNQIFDSDNPDTYFLEV